jgi:hypothetical protein
MIFYDFGGWTPVFVVLVTAVICDAFGIWMGGFRRIEFGDALPGPLPVGEGEHWATIACRITVRGPRWAFPPRLPGGPRLPGLFAI